MAKKLDLEVANDRDALKSGTLVPLNITAAALPAQCAHVNARGQYVILTLPGVRTAGADRWHTFDPPTKMQALFWSDNVESRRRRVHWLCFECNEVMPLGSYEP